MPADSPTSAALRPMLNVHKLVADQATYYERSVAEAREDYYAGRGEARGVWAGSGAEALGLEGELTDGDLAALLRMRDPATGEQLRRPIQDRVVRVERRDPRTGELMVEEQALRPVAAYDLTFGLPKSLSVLEALSDPDTAAGRHAIRAVREAHRAGVHAALSHLEAHALYVRTGRDGLERHRPEGAICASFEHRTSRAQEPHRHTHLILANLAKGKDGIWRALDGRAILGPERLAMGYLYQAEVRRVMCEAGFRFSPVQKGMAELAELPRGVLAEFSTRRRTLEHMQARGTSGYYAARTAARATRAPKVAGELDLEAARGNWLARAAEHGLGREEIDALCRLGLARAGHLATEAPEPEALLRQLAGPKGLTLRRNSFVRAEVVRAVAAAHRQGVAPERVEALVERFLDGEEVVALGGGRYTTVDLLRAEERLLARARDAPGAGRGVLWPALVDEVIAAEAAAGRPLGPDQAAVVGAVTSSGRALEIVEAHAGAGKTHTLGVIGECYRRAGYQVVGAAPTARAARELRAAGVPARTMDSLCLRLASTGGFPPGQRVVVLNDEAGMNPTRLFEALAAYAERAGAKYVAVGDSCQLPAVAAGGAFAALAAGDTLTLDHVRRQRDPVHRRALALLRAGDTDAYVRWQLGRDLVQIGPHEEILAKATRAWASAQEGLAWGQVVLLARSNDLRGELNLYARAEARTRRWLVGPPLEAGSREYRAGDRVIARRNDRDLDTDNGDRGTVVEVRPRRGEVVVMTDDERTVTYPPGYLAAGLLEHAYALTGHGAQGATLERAIRVARPEEHSREWTYTADSREREPSPTFLVDAPSADELRFGEEGHGPIGFGVLRQDALGRYARALARSEAATLASDHRQQRVTKTAPVVRDTPSCLRFPLQMDLARGSGQTTSIRRGPQLDPRLPPG